MPKRTQDGLTRKHPLWRRWKNMIERCEYPSCKDFKNYGARGIKVCDRWKHFPSFLEDMEQSFFEGATLERMNNDGDYHLENVKWATPREQRNNTRRTEFIDTPWGRMSRGDAALRAGIPVGRFIARVKNGWSMDRLFDPAFQRKANRWDGYKKS